MTTPEHAAGVLLRRDNLAFGRMSIEPTAAADGQVLDGPFQTTGPAHAQWRFEVLGVGIGAGEVTVVGVPVVFGVGQRTGERAADFGNLQIGRRKLSLSARTEDIQVT